MFTNNLIAGASGQSGDFYPYAIDQSLRFNDNDTAYLNRTPASTTNRKTWTWSGWVKRGNLVGCQLFSSGLVSGTYNYHVIGFSGNDRLNFNYYPDGSASAGWLSTARLFRDPSAWYHIHAVWDTTQATSTDRMRLYVNGVQETDFVTETFSERYPSQNTDGFVNNSSYQHRIGQHVPGSSNALFDGYMAEVNFIDGQALEPTDFGEFKSGVWVAKEYTGSYGTNGFHLTFADSGAIGDDTSGNTNDWTANNLAATDVLPDSPTNNFAVMNPLWKSSNTVLEEGNLYLPSRSYYSNAVGTIGVSSGKWYFEARVGNNVGSYYTIGVIATDDNTFINKVTSNLRSNVTWSQFSTIYSDGTNVSSPTSPNLGSTTATKIVGCAIDLDNNKVYFHGNGTWVDSSDPDTNTGGTTIDAAIQGKTFVPLIGTNNVSGSPNTQVNFGQDGTFVGTETAQGNTDENGYGDFYYPVPSGFLSMCSANLSAGAIDPAQDDVPADYFNTVLWAGDGTAGRTITGVGFQADLIWIKNRSSASFTHQLLDAVRGKLSGANSYARLRSDTTAIEATPGGDDGLTDITSDGFTVDADESYNNSGNNFVAWNWLAGNGTSSNTDGSVTTTVSANQTAGFSIVKYQGTGSALTCGHGLASPPKFIVVKATDDAKDWTVYHVGMGNNKDMLLNLTNAENTSVAWNNTTPTSSVFSVGTLSNVNVSGKNYISYCFAEIPSYSAFGEYTGNGNSDGPFIFTGHAPAFIMYKRKDSTGNWRVMDNKRLGYNGAVYRLYPNLSNAEVTGNELDILSNGFKLRNTAAEANASGGTYIYASFASNPFKYALAR